MKAPAGPVVVTGMHRTGTSMVAKALRLGGLWLGGDDDLIEAAPDNPDGFFEHAGIVALNDDLLEATGGAWDQPPVTAPRSAADRRVADLGGKARELVDTLATRSPWGWKDPRTCLTARFWLDVAPDARFVVCVRHPLEVAVSLRRRNQASYAHGLSLWRRYYDELLDAVPAERRVLTHYDTHFARPEPELRRLLAFAGLRPDAVAAAGAALDPELRHHRPGPSLAAAGVETQLAELYARLCDEAGMRTEPPGPEATEPAAAVAPPAERVSGVTGDAIVHRAVLDVAAADELARQRARRIESLERQLADAVRDRDELATKVESLERTAAVAERLDRVEEELLDLRYALEARDADPSIAACRAAVRTHVPRDAPVLVIDKGDPALADMYGRPASSFPQDGLGRYPGFALGHSTAAIAHLEALRARGHRFLLVPSASGWWLDEFPAFTDHLVTNYQPVAGGPPGGLLLDVTARRPPPGRWPRALAATMEQLDPGSAAPTALDWSGIGLEHLLPGRRVFTPPPGVATLPYLDATFDVVVVAAPAHDADHDAQADGRARLDEARRVARVAAVTVTPTFSAGRSTFVEVVAVDLVDLPGPTADEAGRTVVLVAGEPGSASRASLREALHDEPAHTLVVTCDVDEMVEAAAEAETVALLDAGVLPLPGCVATARTTLRAGDGAGGVAVKLLAGDGSLAAAGSTVFADGSAADVAAGTYDVAAAWHEYVRPTCWGPGLMVVSGAALAAAGGLAGALAGGGPTAPQPAVAGALWAGGHRVVYQPAAAAVRIDEPSRPRGAPAGDPTSRGDSGVAGRAREPVEAWRDYGRERARPPVRPGHLDPEAWRAVLAVEDVAGGWR